MWQISILVYRGCRIVCCPLPKGLNPVFLSILFTARFYVGGAVACISIVAALFSGYLTAVAALSGVAFMLSNGPVAVYRAQAQIAKFTLAALFMQIGLSIPRLCGLLLGGVPGCMLAVAAWYLLTCVVLTASFVRRLEPATLRQVMLAFGSSLPLFVFSSLWLLYLLANRWIAAFLSTPNDAGLFAFGTSCVSIGLGVIGTISQAFYPRHLAKLDKPRLMRELFGLLLLAAAGSIVGSALCRFALASVFPRYNDARWVVPPLLISALPLCLCMWLVPMIIARVKRPWREAIWAFPVNLAVLAVAMTIGSYAGVVGQAWACIPSALAMFGVVLYFAVRERLINSGSGYILWITVCLVIAFNGGISLWII